MTAPTEAEIRATVEAWFVDNGSLNGWGQLVDAFSNASGSVLDKLYNVDDLRQSEEDAINQVEYEAMVPIRDRVRGELVEALVAGGLRFAVEFPDAPRAVREPVTA